MRKEDGEEKGGERVYLAAWDEYGQNGKKEPRGRLEKTLLQYCTEIPKVT